jgi:serine/threonine protein kinase
MMLKLSRHPNLVRFWGSCSEGEEQFILTELAPHGSVLKVIEELHDTGRVLPMQHKIEIMRQVASACEALALEGIVHRDIAARNVLLSVFDPAVPSSTVAKVSDFGMSVCAYGRSSLTVDGGTVHPGILLLCFFVTIWTGSHALDGARVARAPPLEREDRRVVIRRAVLGAAQRRQAAVCSDCKRCGGRPNGSAGSTA